MGMEWEEAVIEGIQARQQRDGAQWRLGDLALQVETSYGERTLETYAESIGVEYNTLQQYRWVSSLYEKSVRTDSLTWSHHERIAGRKDRLEWLKAAAEHGWSVRRMRAEILKADPELDPQLETLQAQTEAWENLAWAMLELKEEVDRTQLADLTIEELIELKNFALGVQNFSIEHKLRLERKLGQIVKEMKPALDEADDLPW
jgi:hypothetical protein